MRPYIKNKEFKPTYPEEFNKIMEYLTSNGRVYVEPPTIEELYRQFSDEKFCSGWAYADDNTIEYFAEWLEDLDI